MLQRSSYNFGGSLVRYTDRVRKVHLRTITVVFFCLPLSISAEFRFEPKFTAEASVRSDKTQAKVNSSASKSGWRIRQSYSQLSDKPSKSLIASYQDTDLVATVIATRVQPTEIISSPQKRSMGAGDSDFSQSMVGPEDDDLFDPFSPEVSAEEESISQKSVDDSDLECADFQFSEGLLKANLIRLLKMCDFTIGRWGIGDEEYEYDMEIPKAYLLKVNGIAKLLESVEASYLVRGTRNNLDRTVDFEPSRGAILEGMEIKEW